MRKPDSRSYRLGPVRIFREELEYVSTVAAAPGKIEFRHDGFIYDSLGELADHLNGRPVHSMVIQPMAGDGVAAVSILPHQVEVFALSETAAPAEQIVAYLRAHARGTRPLWWRVLYGSVVWLVAILIGAVVLALSDVPMRARSLAAGFVAIAIVSLFAGMERQLGESAVYLRERDAPSTDRRALIFLVAAISGLIGLTLGIALGGS